MRSGRVEVTGGFLMLVAWLNYLDRELVVPLAMAACGLHELGHYAAIRLLGGDIKYIRLTAVGAEMALERPMGYWQEGAAALAGPGMNLLLALGCCLWEKGVTFAGLNLVLACFNLLPIGRLDGGRVLRCAISLLVGPDAAERIGERLDLTLTAALLGLGLFLAGVGRNITLLLVAVWLLVAYFRGNYSGEMGNRACQRSRKQVK